MKSKKIIILPIIWIFVFSIIFASDDFPSPTLVAISESLRVDLWIDKGCGATYEVDEKIIIYFKVNQCCYATLFYETETTWDFPINDEFYSAGTHHISLFVNVPTGMHNLTITVLSPDEFETQKEDWKKGFIRLVDYVDDTCTFYVKSNKGEIKTIVKDENGNRMKDAKIYLDGDYQGNTNSEGEYLIEELSPDKYTVGTSKSGYEDDSEYVSVEAGETKIVYLILKEEKSSLSVTVKDQKENRLEDISIYVDGSAKGVTDHNGEYTISNISPGKHTIEIEKENYEQYTKTVELSSGESKNISVTLNLKRAELSISSNPSASVYINENYKGDTPVNIKLDPGDYTIEIKKDKYNPYITAIELSPGKTKSMYVTLHKNFAYYQKYILLVVVIFVFLPLLIYQITKKKPEKKVGEPKKLSKKEIEKLKTKLDDDYVEGKISREEYLRRKKELGK